MTSPKNLNYRVVANPSGFAILEYELFLRGGEGDAQQKGRMAFTSEISPGCKRTPIRGGNR